MEKIMTLKELAQALRIHYLTARELVVEGKIPAAKVGRVWRVRESSVSSYLAAQTAGREMEKEQPPEDLSKEHPEPAGGWDDVWQEIEEGSKLQGAGPDGVQNLSEMRR